jgi:hypothetical protein
MKGCFVAGADPELMLISPDGNLISAIGLVPGTKEKPHKVSKGAIQRDNVLAEFNVAPARSSEEFEHNIREVLRELAKEVHPHRLMVMASANYPDEALESDEARIFGCDPDFDAWALAMNRMDGTAAFQNFRSAGGHLHIGKKKRIAEMLDDDYGKVEVIKMCDVFLGIPSVVLDSDPSAADRRRLYGKSGSYRPKDYGVEYRSLGNFWLADPEKVRLIYQLADLAVSLTFEGESTSIIEQVGETDIPRIINESDQKAARKVVEGTLAQYLPKGLSADILCDRVETDFYGNWGI